MFFLMLFAKVRMKYQQLITTSPMVLTQYFLTLCLSQLQMLKVGRKHDLSIGSTLVKILSVEVIVLSLSNDEALLAFLCLMEINLCNKFMNGAVVGLVIAKCLLKKCPSLHSSFFKYGLRELFNACLNNAVEALFSIEQSSLPPEPFYENPIVCCPKVHI